MKKYISIITAALMLISLSSCEDFLTEEPQSVLTQLGFYTTPERINKGILGSYAGMTLTQNDEWMYTELRSDNSCIASTGSSSSTRQYLTSFAHFSLISSEPVLQNFWYHSFQNISNINGILPNTLDNTYITVESTRAQYEAELRFLRALHYLQLVNLFGDVFKVTTVIGPDEALTIPRSPVSEIYDEIIIPDLEIAAEQAPPSYGTSDLGRVTSWAAKGILAKAYMMQGGSDNLAKAKLLLEEVMTSGHDLEPVFADVFSTENEVNNEIIFAVRYRGGDYGIGSPFWEYFAPEGSANQFLAVGSPDGNNNPTLELMGILNSDTIDTRIDATFDVFVRSATRQYPYTTKYIDPDISQALQGENDWIVLRYADILLLYAEILAQDGGYANAHTYVNLIRDRAGVDPMDPFASPEMALDSVYQERRKELAFENHRWYDLLRMNTSYNDPNKAMDIIRFHTFHTDSILYESFRPLPPPDEANYTNEHLLLPIPQIEIDSNNELDLPQNPGY